MNEELLVCFELGSAGFLWPPCPVLKKGKSNSFLPHGFVDLHNFSPKPSLFQDEKP